MKQATRTSVLAAALTLAALTASAVEPPPSLIPGNPANGEQEKLSPPSVEFGELYRAVELSHVFDDQKTFADAIPAEPPPAIVSDYERLRGRKSFDLRAFVDRHFLRPTRNSVNYKAEPQESVQDYVAGMWDVLLRRHSEVERYSSLLTLPDPYVVPGGRFSEVYYWDSYFTMLGLERDGRHDLATGMLRDLASLIDRYGHVPNGNRTYYLSRSEPPFFACMVELIAERDGDSAYQVYLPKLRREYDYWMEGQDELTPGGAHRRVVRLADGTVLNRYWDDRAAPRDESYAEDVDTAKRSSRPAEEVYRDLRAGGETGWDFSSRWLADPLDLATIRTSAILPVDLNSLLAHVERVLAKAYALSGEERQSEDFTRRADLREEAIRRWMWDGDEGVFTDYIWTEGVRSGAVSLATVFPLYFRIATDGQAHAVAGTLRTRFLRAGGLPTTLTRSGQQWDAPNGWAPLQYLAVGGLDAYGETALAREIAGRWIETNVSFYETSGVLLEKYDVERADTGRSGGGGGGEYPLQVGFGWTNGVLLTLMAQYPEQKAEALAQHPKAAAR